MKCHICDATMSGDSIQWNPDHQDWDPCGTCLMVISEVFTDHLDEDQIDWALAEEWEEPEETNDDLHSPA
jgi:hypothetical protein